MKTRLLILFLTLTVVPAFCQQTEPIWYINSELVDFKTILLNPQSIESIEVYKPNIYIKTKKPLVTLSFEDILKNYTSIENLDAPAVFIVNGHVITDKHEIKTDDPTQLKVRTKTLATVNYIDAKYRDLIIIEIGDSHVSPQQNQEPGKIYIRGTTVSLTAN